MVFHRKEWSAKYYFENKEIIRLKAKIHRRMNVAKSILVDSRKYDKKFHYENDLDLVFIENIIKNDCFYCGENNLRKTLDRIDNSKGHMKENVLLACERCNYVRRDMPHQAWMMLISGMRQARGLKLFGEWTGGIHKRKDLEPSPTTKKIAKELPRHGTTARYQKCGPPHCYDCKIAMKNAKRISREKEKMVS